MKPTKKIDQEVSYDTALDISDIPMVLKHVNKLQQIVKGFVFAYIDKDLTYYDTVEVIRECNGHRLKIPKLLVAPVVLERLKNRVYQRWYVHCGKNLHPLQQAKPNDIMNAFIFLVSDDPRYRTQTAYPGETLFIRKKPLVACRPVRVDWGDSMPDVLVENVI